MMTMTEIARDNRIREVNRLSRGTLEALARSLGVETNFSACTRDELAALVLDAEDAR